MSGITIRPFATLEELKGCVALQEETWGVGFSERVPTAILHVGQLLGGVSAGAYDEDGALVGFVFGLTGLRDGELAHWSDMLAVRPEIRDTGLGRRLKEYQRTEVLGRGVAKMYWTFDPLQSRNAYLNLMKLGAVVREYRENMYGDSDSPLHQGIGTDRFVALWLLDTERAAHRLSGSEDSKAVAAGLAARSEPALAIDPEGAHPRPVRLERLDEFDVVRIPIPSNIDAVKASDLELARAWRTETRRVFTHYLGAGYEVRELIRGDVFSDYLMTRIEV